jgi:hypothetical protein
MVACIRVKISWNDSSRVNPARMYDSNISCWLMAPSSNDMFCIYSSLSPMKTTFTAFISGLSRPIRNR